MTARNKIVVLDGYTLNPGDLSWDGLKTLGDTTVYDRSEPDQVAGRAAGARIALVNKAVMDRETIARLPGLEYIGVLATGYNVVDLAAARERGIVVTNVPDYGTRSVAQMTFALLLELAHRAGHHAQSVRDGRWSGAPDFCYWDYPLVELDGLVMGIIGLGRIGRAVAGLSLAFGMRVLAHDPGAAAPPPAGVEMCGLDSLLRQADVVSLHCPLTAENRGFIDAGRLSLMKPGAFLVNTARGPLVDERALADALDSGRMAGAALDVLSLEPPPPGNPLLTAANCIVTPHIAWATRAARRRLMAVVAENVRAFLEGAPQNAVS